MKKPAHVAVPGYGIQMNAFTDLVPNDTCRTGDERMIQHHLQQANSACRVGGPPQYPVPDLYVLTRGNRRRSAIFPSPTLMDEDTIHMRMKVRRNQCA